MDRINKDAVILILILVLVASMGIELAASPFPLILILAGIVGLYLTQSKGKESYSLMFILSLAAISLALLNTYSAWIILAILVIIIFTRNQSFFQSLKDSLFETNFSWTGSEYISVKFDQDQERSIKRTRRKWIGRESDENLVYQWEDIVYTKFAGDTFIDLGNTIMPKDQNVILIRKVFGDLKILIPQEVAVSLDISILLGKVRIGEDELTLNNEVVTYRSDHFDQTDRKLKIMTTSIFGDVEVVFLWKIISKDLS